MQQSQTNGAVPGATGATVTDSRAQELQPTEAVVIDAGNRSLDHYKLVLPKWRYKVRQHLLPLIRWETPYLAWLQAKVRTPALDSYFAITANLGTHTFFMIFLPIMFWCGKADLGKGLVHILAAGVFFSGFVKDFFSLPRPLSPPLHRITMSGSVALEYGFPSTHSANAVSVAVYGFLILRSPDNTLSLTAKLGLQLVACFYTATIVLGRLYCGMHGFLDVIVGSAMGAAISLMEFYYGPTMDSYLHESTLWSMLILVLTVIVLVRVHPEPADDCPCFDDSVAFAGVVIGVEMGTWHFGHSPYALKPFNLAALGWLLVVVRIMVGVFAVFAWREVAKLVLLTGLPHLFRLFETWGVDLPRRFFMPASEYKDIPLRLRVDNVMPSVSDLPEFMKNIRHPRRARSISVGPQSAADAYETLAYREKRRTESIGSKDGVGSKMRSVPDLKATTPASAAGEGDGAGRSSALSNGWAGRVSDYERMMGEGTVQGSLPQDDGAVDEAVLEPQLPVTHRQRDELGEQELFHKLVKQRVRYDVEVVTKLVVYTGVGLMAVDGVPLGLELIGLGLRYVK